MSWTLAGQVRDSSVPGLLLRAVPGVITIISVVVAARGKDEQRLPFWAVVVLGVIVVVSNVSLFGLKYGEPPGPAGYGMLVFTAAGCLLWYALPASAMIVIPYWASRGAVRYFRPGRLEWAVVAVSIVGVSVPLYITTRSAPGAFGAAFGLVALTLAAVNRRSREQQLEELEVSLARKQAAIEEHGRAAALAERARIARDMHDVLAHSLAGLSLSLQGARLMLVRDGASPEAIEQVTRAQGLAAEGLTEARRAVAALREDAVPDVRALGDLVTAYRLESGAEASFEVEGAERELPAEVMSTLYRTVQEALVNTRKHAPRAPVQVRLSYGDPIRLVVDDTQDKRPERAAPGGYGLLGMRERADLVGGSLEAGPTSTGWRVELKVPA
ncbi:signal transduction histidine kinase [Kribbella aluminosa]|uniref:histidine kinase n=1 Tax=Kribbella aluminosa TaxID=416017 RepID=A0ABS4UVQ6_9ACTN|nr:histidine kinase [Kribbella aluminosa]MBP2355715.1 signal transduction histidine kinase [Kribbella aluminosa]